MMKAIESGTKGMTLQPQMFSKVFELAHKAGMSAVEKLRVVPMIVNQHASLLDDGSPIKASWVVADGICGFAQVVVRPANSGFAKWLHVNHDAYNGYSGGMIYRVRAFNQSFQKKRRTL